MLISVPFRSADMILKHKDIGRALSYISSHRQFTLKHLADEAGLSRKVAKSIVRDMLWTEHLEREGQKISATNKILSESITLNLRDIRTDALFKWRKTREILMKISGCLNLRELSVYLKIRYPTLRWILYRLREAGMVLGFSINNDLILTPENPLEYVPRKTHRNLLGNFLSMIKKFKMNNIPVILYGDASWGKDVLVLELLALIEGCLEEEEQVKTMENFVIAAKNLTSSFGAKVELSFAMKEVWLAHKLGFAAEENSTLKRTEDGICICGRLPTKEDYFEMHERVNPSPPDKLAEWIKKGYVQKIDGRYVYTEKAIERFKQVAPTYIDEVLLPIFDRKIRFIAVGKPRAK